MVTAANLNNLTIIEIYGQKYSVVKIVPLRIAVETQAGESGVLRYAVVPYTDVTDITKPKNFLITYALISPEFWVDRGSAYATDDIDFEFNIKDMNVAEDFTVVGSNISILSDYFGKLKMLSDELITFPEINWETPLMWTYWGTPQRNPQLVFKSSNGSASNYTVYFTATLVKLHIIPDDLVDPTEV